MNACIDCRNHKYEPGFAVGTFTSICLRPQIIKHHPVRGPVVDGRTCSFERANWPKLFGFNVCGRKGTYFSKRPDPQPPRGGSAVKPKQSPPGRI